MSVKLLTEHHLEFLNLSGGCTVTAESTLSKCHIVGNYISRLICIFLQKTEHLGVIVYSYFVPVRSLVKTITPRCRG